MFSISVNMPQDQSEAEALDELMAHYGLESHGWITQQRVAWSGSAEQVLKVLPELMGSDENYVIQINK